jgi:hypothetical protein
MGTGKPEFQRQPWLTHFHASACKNTAHKFAARVFTQRVAATDIQHGTRALLCNWDCDNIMFPAFPQAAMEAMAAKAANAQKLACQLGSFAMVPPSTCHHHYDRCMYFLEDFVASGGYDQEVGIYGTGHMAAY